MVIPVKLRELKSRDILSLPKISLTYGASGLAAYPFQVREIKLQHNVYCTISVFQPSGRTDLDIGFLVMDADNYQKWASNQPSTAFIIAPRFTFGTLMFEPKNTGSYYAVFNNRYSVLTGKDVSLRIFETWIEEKEVGGGILPAQEAQTRPRLSLLRRFLNRLRSSRILGVFGLLVALELVSVFVAIAVAVLLHSTLGVNYSETMGYVTTAIGGSTVIVLIYLYFLLTGKSLAQLTPSS
jgi:hypothetical protein